MQVIQKNISSLSFNKRCLFNLFLGSLSALSFAPLNFIFILFITIPFYILNFDFFFLKKSLYSQKKFLIYSFLFGLSFGYGLFLTSLYWINISLLYDIERYMLFLIPGIFLIPFILGIFYGIMTIIFSIYYPQNITRIFLVAIIWTLIEYIRIKITFFPWAQIGHSIIEIDQILQIASVFGEVSLNTISVIIFAFPILYITERNKNYKSKSLLFFVIFLFVIFIYGERKLSLDGDNRENTEIILIQPNINQKEKWDPKSFQSNKNKLINPTNEISNLPRKDTTSNRYFIWPETAIATLIDENPLLTYEVTKNFSKNDYLMLGSLRRENENIFNSFFIIDYNNIIIGKYDKNILVPFGEYIPFDKLFRKLSFLNISSLAGNFTPGSKSIEILNSLKNNPIVYICYEIVFSNKIQDGDIEKSFLLNITNDAWFGNSSGPYQHFNMSKIRPVELGMPLVRVANNGISGIINPFGKEILRSKLNTEFHKSILLPSRIEQTFYSKYGNIPFFCILLFGFMLIYYFNNQMSRNTASRKPNVK